MTPIIDHGFSRRVADDHPASHADFLWELIRFCEGLPIAVAVVDLAQHFVGVNKRFAASDGRPIESYGGAAVRTISSALANHCIRALTSGVTVHSFEAAAPDLRENRAETYHPMRDRYGVVQGVCIFRQEVTPQHDVDLVFRQLQDELNGELRFRAMIGEMFGRLANLSENGVDDEITRALLHIRSHADVDQTSLLQFSALDGDVHVTQCCQLEPNLWLPPVLRENDFPWYLGMMRQGRVLRMSGLDDLPPEASTERNHAAKAGVRSHLCVPLSSRGTTLGGIALTCFKRERVWPDELLEQLHVIAHVLSNVLALNTVEMELRRSVKELTQLRDKLQSQSNRLREEIHVIRPNDEIVDHSDAMRQVLVKVHQVAQTDSTVLILGETGTGKELIARAIHHWSKRTSKTMIKVNCAALPSALVESELFGSEKGAYTGSMSMRVGRFELAHGSTILLDEIGDLPLELQGKLLRVLQEGEFERLGSSKTMHVNARVVAATNRDLAAAVREGTFREDLYYRLNVFTIKVPPLREHAEDIPSLVWRFVRVFGESMAKKISTISPATMEAMRQYPWPGNVRQLRNVIERAMIVNTTPELLVELPPLEGISATVTPMTLVDMERSHILKALEQSHWRVSGINGAAQLLGLKPTTLESRMQKLGIHRKT